MEPGSSAQTNAWGSNTTRRPVSWVLKVVKVSSASDTVDPATDGLELPGMQLGPAGQAGQDPEDVLAHAAPGGDVLIADEAVM